jgi:hypothetical protein
MQSDLPDSPESFFGTFRNTPLEVARDRISNVAGRSGCHAAGRQRAEFVGARRIQPSPTQTPVR